MPRTKSFKNTFFLYCINKWNYLLVEIRNYQSVSVLKKLNKCEKKENSIFSIHDTFGVKLLTRLRLQFSNLNEHKFRHGFVDTINTMCTCESEVETTEHFLLHCHLYFPQRLELSENLEKIDSSFLNSNVKDKYGYQLETSKSSNYKILKF